MDDFEKENFPGEEDREADRLIEDISDENNKGDEAIPLGPSTGTAGNPYEQHASGYQFQQPQQMPNPNYYQSYYMNDNSQGTEPKKEKKIKGTYIAIGVLSFLLVCTLLINIATLVPSIRNSFDRSYNNSQRDRSGGANIEISETPTSDIKVQPGSTELLTPAQVAAKVRPSVVSVITYNPTVLGQSGGQGSGIIYNPNGYIITNSHVIGDTKQMRVTVVLHDGKEYDASVLGFDRTTDIAVLKINATGLTEAEFGESDKIVPGDEVIAIGNPGGEQFAGSITRGIVSGLNRVIDESSNYESSMKYIQTDAAINPGNSGGALVNMYGQVIGINTAKIAATGYEGIGFAIPIATAVPIAEDLSSLGYVDGRVKLGISCSVITPTAAQYYGVPSGLLLQEIDNDSDLNGKAQLGDIITEADGNKIESMASFQDALKGKKAGDSITLKMYSPATRASGYREYTITVTLIPDTGESTNYRNS